MSRYTYDLFEPSTDSDVSLEKLTKEFAPLHMKAWQQMKQATYDKAYDLNVSAFAAMWLNKSLKIFMAYDNGTPCGYLNGIVFRPLQYQATTFQIEDWYAVNIEVEEGLFDYMRSAIRFLGCDEVLVTTQKNQPVRQVGSGWKLKTQTITYRYVRE